MMFDCTLLAFLAKWAMWHRGLGWSLSDIVLALEEPPAILGIFRQLNEWRGPFWKL